jgi:hypothetical protein
VLQAELQGESSSIALVKVVDSEYRMCTLLLQHGVSVDFGGGVSVVAAVVAEKIS